MFKREGACRLNGVFIGKLTVNSQQRLGMMSAASAELVYVDMEKKETMGNVNVGPFTLHQADRYISKDTAERYIQFLECLERDLSKFVFEGGGPAGKPERSSAETSVPLHGGLGKDRG